MLRHFRNLSFLVLALSLSACAAGGGGGAYVVTAPVASNPLEFATQYRSPVRSLPASRTHFGSVAVYAGPKITGIDSSFDGSHATATISRANRAPLGLDTRGTYADHGRHASVTGLPGRTSHTRLLFGRTANSATLSLLIVDWASDDPTDYLAGGYWVHAAAGSPLEAGAFVHGRELSLSDPPDMPVSGTARYEGTASGMYAARYGTDAAVAAGSEDLGRFTGSATLTADFSSGTIEGCIGCTSPIRAGGVVYDPSGRFEVYRNRDTGWIARYGSTPIDRSKGTFHGTNVSMSHAGVTITGASGSWAGQFSNRLDGSSNPRLVAGTLNARGSTAGGSQAVVMGVFGAGRQ